MDLTPCRLYLVSPTRFDPDAYATLLDSVLAAMDVASLELRLEGAEIAIWERAIRAVLPVTQARNVALLLGDRPELAAETGCDGVYLPLLESYDEARQLLGAGAIVGVSAQGSRHQAMEAAEQGADFVGIGAASAPALELDLLTWWAELMEVPSVGFGVRTAEDCTQVVDAGADFLCPDPAIWDAPQGAVAALTGLLAAVVDPDDDDLAEV